MNLQYGSILGLIVLIIDIVAIVEIIKGSKDTLGKILWSLLILLFPLVGVIIYYLVGRGR